MICSVSDWKHQRVSHPVVKQALMRDRAGYITFRHSRSPSLATIPENQLIEDQIYIRAESTEKGEDREAEEEEEEFEDHVLVELDLDSEVACALAHTSQERLTKTGVAIKPGYQPQYELDEVTHILEVQDAEDEEQVPRIDCFEESDMGDTDMASSQFQATSITPSLPISISKHTRTFSGPHPSPLAMSPVHTTPLSSTTAFIRPRSLSTTSTATNSSVSTVKPNKSLERMLMMMRRTDKTTDLHTEYLGDEDEEGLAYIEDTHRDIAPEDDNEEDEEDDRSIIQQPCPREAIQLHRHNASMHQLEKGPGQGTNQGRRFSLQYDLGMKSRRSSRDSSCENFSEQVSSRRFSLPSVSTFVEGGSHGSKAVPSSSGGGGAKVKGVWKWIREFPPRLKRRVSVSERTQE